MNPYNAPKAIVWELSSRCNLACPGCPCATGGRKTELSAQAASDVVDAVGRWMRSPDGDAVPDGTGHPGSTWDPGVLVLSGGEPLVRDDTLELARRAIGAGIKVAMTTNGSLINKECAVAIAAAGVAAVGIPVDGANADTHDGLRRRSGAFKGALNGVRALAEHGVPVWAMTRVLAGNADQLHDISGMVRDAGARAQVLFPAGSSPCRFPVRDDQEYVDSAMPACELHLRVAGISPEGDLYPCPGTKVPMGNVRNSPIDRLWADAEYLHEPREHAGGERHRCPVCVTWARSVC